MKARVVLPGGGRHLDVLGIEHRITVAAEDTGGAYALVEIVNAPGLGIPPHVHANEEETFHVLEGNVTFQVGEESLVASPGTTVHLPRGVPHRFAAEGTAPARMLLVLSPAGLERMFQELSELPGGGPPDLDKVAAICARYGIRFV